MHELSKLKGKHQNRFGISFFFLLFFSFFLLGVIFFFNSIVIFIRLVGRRVFLYLSNKMHVQLRYCLRQQQRRQRQRQPRWR